MVTKPVGAGDIAPGTPAAPATEASAKPEVMETPVEEAAAVVPDMDGGCEVSSPSPESPLPLEELLAYAPIQDEAHYGILRRFIKEYGRQPDPVEFYVGDDGKSYIAAGYDVIDACRRENIPVAYTQCPENIKSLEDAKDYALNRYLARQHLGVFYKRYFLGELYNRRKKAQGGTGTNKYNKQSSEKPHSVKTAAIIAKEYHTTANAVRYAVDYYEKVNRIVQKYGKEAKVMILSGRKSVKDYESKSKKPAKSVTSSAPVFVDPKPAGKTAKVDVANEADTTDDMVETLTGIIDSVNALMEKKRPSIPPSVNAKIEDLKKCLTKLQKYIGS